MEKQAYTVVIRFRDFKRDNLEYIVVEETADELRSKFTDAMDPGIDARIVAFTTRLGSWVAVDAHDLTSVQISEHTPYQSYGY